MMTHAPMRAEGMTTPEASILLVDDDVELAALMHEFFARRGMSLEAESDGRRGLARALVGGHDLVLLDVMMPGLDGFELLRLVRRRSPVPVIMLTAQTAQANRVLGLDSGADDYLPKPFDPEELLARIRAVLRRVEGARRLRASVAESGPVRLAAATRSAWCDGRALALTALEFDIFEQLVRAEGRIVSRDELMTILHHRRATPFDRSLDVHVSHIRRKLGRSGSLIRTIRGVGYLFAAGSGSGPGQDAQT
jgi:two-component system response regulator CpxR